MSSQRRINIFTYCALYFRFHTIFLLSFLSFRLRTFPFNIHYPHKDPSCLRSRLHNRFQKQFLSFLLPLQSANFRHTSLSPDPFILPILHAYLLRHFSSTELPLFPSVSLPFFSVFSLCHLYSLCNSFLLSFSSPFVLFVLFLRSFSLPLFYLNSFTYSFQSSPFPLSFLLSFFLSFPFFLHQLFFCSILLCSLFILIHCYLPFFLPFIIPFYIDGFLPFLLIFNSSSLHSFLLAFLQCVISFDFLPSYYFIFLHFLPSSILFFLPSFLFPHFSFLFYSLLQFFLPPFLRSLLLFYILPFFPGQSPFISYLLPPPSLPPSLPHFTPRGCHLHAAVIFTFPGNFFDTTGSVSPKQLAT